MTETSSAAAEIARLSVANKAIRYFAPRAILQLINGRVYVCWDGGRKMLRSQGRGLYPDWVWPYGAPTSTAVLMLGRWVKGKPVFGLATWEYWVGPGMLLARGNGDALLGVLKTGGWPSQQLCYLCKSAIPPGQGLDWGARGRHSGPICANPCPHRKRAGGDRK